MIEIARISKGLVEIEPGYWESPLDSDVSYPSDGHAVVRGLEDESFWFRHRNDVILSVLRRFPPEGEVFDIGAGSGFVAIAMRDAGYPVVVVEPGVEGARNARARGLDPVVCGMPQSVFDRGTVPAGALFDVVEHVDDDVAFLTDIGGLIRPGGRLYITVPAYSWLWSEADYEAGHFRRYTRRAIAKVASGAGLTVEYATYFFGILPLPIFVLRAVPSRLGRGAPISNEREHQPPRGVAGHLLQWRLRRELRAMQSGRKRFGASILVVARRPTVG